MAYDFSVLSQLLKTLPRHEFEKLGGQHDGKHLIDALARWNQGIALALGHLSNSHSLRDIEAPLST